jgi:hypothetical protein
MILSGSRIAKLRSQDHSIIFISDRATIFFAPIAIAIAVTISYPVFQTRMDRQDACDRLDAFQGQMHHRTVWTL